MGDWGFNEQEVKQKRKNKSYSLTYRGSHKDSDKKGVMYDETPCLYELPQIGAKVIVRQKEVFVRSPGDTSLFGDFEEEHIAWRTPSRFYDAFHKPAIYDVVGYSLGIDKPMDVRNDVILQRKCHGNILEERLRTIYIASGSTQLLEV